MFSDADIGFVDAATIALAERMDIRRMYSLDRRDFSLVRPAQTGAFEVLP